MPCWIGWVFEGLIICRVGLAGSLKDLSCDVLDWLGARRTDHLTVRKGLLWNSLFLHFNLWQSTSSR
jgi:hypothetical protein